MASTYLSRSVTTTGNQKTWTFSAWVKRSKLGSVQYIVSAKGSGETTLYFRAIDDLQLELYDGNNYYIRTNRLFRDTSAWYHIVAVWDSTQSNSSDRMKLYVNGVQETSFSVSIYPPQNYNSYMNQTGQTNYVGNYHSGSSSYYDGSMSHVHLIDGTAYTPSAFGEYDANGVWKAKTSPSVTYGTNGFFILKDGNSVTDQSGNSNNFTVAGGTLTDTLDCPGNVFATFNPLIRNKSYNDGSLTNGNLGFAPNGRAIACSTLGVTSGKYYAEFKAVDAGALGIGVGDLQLGIQAIGQTNPIYYDNNPSYAMGYYNANGNLNYNGGTIAYGNSYTDGDIIGIALDMDNFALYFSKNGVWQNSGDPTSGALKTGDATSTASYTNLLNSGEPMFMFTEDFSLAGVGECQANFGNGYFGTTAVASAGTNASGNGIFEYDVPTGYTALSTKGLNL